MRSFIVLLAASLVAADRPKGHETPHIAYQVIFLDMDGLGWRSTLYPHLQTVARQGDASVWTASRETVSKLGEKSTEVTRSPRVTALPRVRCSVFQNRSRKIVAEVRREADGPVNHASFVGFVPRVEDATEGYTAEFAGRKIDQGVLAEVTLVDRSITAVHSVPLTEVLESRAGREGEKATPAEATIQVPKYARTAVSGEWLIPRDGVLVVSLGVHTVADANGKAVVRERLAVLEADEVDGDLDVSAVDLALPGPLERIVTSVPRLETPRPMASPALPGRSLPHALDPAGQPVELPTLPDPSDVSTVTLLPGTSEPCASPQVKPPAGPGDPIPWRKSQIRDTEANLTGLRHAPSYMADSVKYLAPEPDLPRANTQTAPARAAGDRAPAPPLRDAGAAGDPVSPPPGCDIDDGVGLVEPPHPDLSPAVRRARVHTPSPFDELLREPGGVRGRVTYPVRWKFDD